MQSEEIRPKCLPKATPRDEIPGVGVSERTRHQTRTLSHTYKHSPAEECYRVLPRKREKLCTNTFSLQERVFIHCSFFFFFGGLYPSETSGAVSRWQHHDSTFEIVRLFRGTRLISRRGSREWSSKARNVNSHTSIFENVLFMQFQFATFHLHRMLIEWESISFRFGGGHQWATKNEKESFMYMIWCFFSFCNSKKLFQIM